MERVVVAIATASSLMAAGVVVVAQGVLDPQALTWERFAGGSVLIVAAALIVRWTFKLIREVREGAKEDREAWAADRKALSEQLTNERQVLAQEREAWSEERRDILAQLDSARVLVAEQAAVLERERELRLSLERLGVHDRREPSG